MSYIGLGQAFPFDPTATGFKQLDAERFSGNDSATTFTLSRKVTSPVDIQVFVENVSQEPIVAYDVVNFTSLVFTEAPPTGTNNIYVIYRDVDLRYSVTVPDGSITYSKLANSIRNFTVDNFTANGTGQTFVLSETPAAANTLVISIDGVLQAAPTNYTLSGTTITFASAPSNGANVTVRHMGFRTTSQVTALSDNSVTTSKIADANVTSAKLASTLSISGNFFANNITANTNFITAAGSAGSPAIQPIGDTNTGIFFPAADTIAFAEGGVEAMRIDSSGKLLVGTTTATLNTRLNAKLGVVSTGSGEYGGAAITSYSGTTAAAGSFIDFNRSRGTTDGSVTKAESGDTLGYLVFRGSDGTNFVDSSLIKAEVDGATGANDMPGRLAFYTSADGSASPTERMRIDSSGNVGIGTTAPSSALEVYLADTTYVRARENLTNKTVGYQIVANGGTPTAVFSSNTATGEVRLGGIATNYFQTFYTSNSERMRIDSSGNVGIGTTSPDHRLDIDGGSLCVNGFADSANNYITLRNGFSPSSGGGIGFRAIDHSGSNADGLGCYGHDGISFLTSQTERARITSDGNFLIGATATVGGTAERLNVTATGNSPAIIAISSSGSVDSTIPTWNKATSGDNLFLQFYTEGAATLRGSIDYNRGAGQTRYNITSDATLKNIIGDANGQKSLEILNSTRIREYAWKNDPTQKPQIGVIAQELYETYKGAVSVGGDFERERDVTEEVEEEYTDEEGNTQTRTVTKVVGKETYTEYRPWGVDKTAFTFHLIAGWQAHEKLLKEAMTRIETLEAEVAAMKAGNGN